MSRNKKKHWSEIVVGGSSSDNLKNMFLKSFPIGFAFSILLYLISNSIGLSLFSLIIFSIINFLIIYPIAQLSNIELEKREKIFTKNFLVKDLEALKVSGFDIISPFSPNIQTDLRTKLRIFFGLSYINNSQESNKETSLIIPFDTARFKHKFPSQGKVISYEKELFFIPDWVEKKLKN